MLTDEAALIFINQLENLYQTQNLINRKKAIKLKSLLNQFFKFLTENENQYFPSNFSRSIYLFDKYKIEQNLFQNYKRLIYALNQISKNKDINPEDKEIANFFEISRYIIGAFAGDKVESKITIHSFSTISELKSIKNAIIIDKKYNDKSLPFIELATEEVEKFKLFIGPEKSYILKIARRGAMVNIFNFSQVKDQLNTYRTTKETIIVFEPDILVDVTDLAKCFNHNTVNPELYLIDFFEKVQVNYPLFLGIIINEFFDLLIIDKKIDFETSFIRALRKNILKTLLLAQKDDNSRKILRSSAYSHFQQLSNFINTFTYDKISIEPTFISPDYGLQGRLDALVEYNDEPNRKDVIELKSGTAPKSEFYITDNEGNKYTIGVWAEHLAQATCYNLLLDSCYENRIGSSGILYSIDKNFLLRNIPNILKYKQELMDLRNNIIGIEKAIANNKYKLIDRLLAYDENKIPTFKLENLKSLKKTLQNLDELEKSYITELISFIYREKLAQKIGPNDSNRNGFSALWNETLEEKEENNTVLSNLTIIEDESDLESLYIVFKPAPYQYFGTSFRTGDIAILYNSNLNLTPYKTQIIKGTIKSINSEKIVFNLRNKCIDKSLLKFKENWVLEPDFIDSTKKTIQSLTKLIYSSPDKRKLLLGLSEPEFDQIETNAPSYLNRKQKETFHSATSAKNYYLIQGPPGTGKTSYMLKALVEYYYQKPDINLLLLAYTNRAIDEICKTLDRVEPKVNYIRIGAKESTQLKENLLAELAERLTLGQLFEKIHITRVYVATVASINYNSEILELKKFDIAIVDEASQILESDLIGILSGVNKFIIIGDEKQLPAVTIQHQAHQICNNELLKSIKLNNFAMSYFERLLRICKENGWFRAYGMLNEQSRMHPQILEFVNKHYYNNQLITNPSSDFSLFDEKNISKNSIITLLNENRIIFIESKIETNFKVNRFEAEVIKLILNKLSDYIGNIDIGIISPFRAQCTEIYTKLPHSWHNSVIIDTIERFQGSEKDIIIISFAINTVQLLSSIQSLCEFDGNVIDRKLNVAITRAKKSLIILGNSRILNKSKVYADLIQYIKDFGIYLTTDEFENLLIPNQFQ